MTWWLAALLIAVLVALWWALTSPAFYWWVQAHRFHRAFERGEIPWQEGMHEYLRPRDERTTMNREQP